MKTVIRSLFHRAALLGLVGAVACVAAIVATTDIAPSAETGCTPQQVKSAEQLAIQLGVDTCQEAPQLVPQPLVGVLVGLVCSVYDSAVEAGVIAAKTSPLLVPQATWYQMKAEYLAKHGKLPEGMAPPPAAAPASSGK